MAGVLQARRGFATTVGQVGELTGLLLLGVLGMPLVPLLIVSTLLSSLGGLGLPLFFGVVAVMRTLAGINRRWAARVLQMEIPAPYRTSEGGVFRRARTRMTDPATWRDFAWCLLNGTVGSILSMLPLVMLAAGVLGLLQPVIYPMAGPDYQFGYSGIEIVSMSMAFTAFGLGLVYLGLMWMATPWLRRARAWLAWSLLSPTKKARLSMRVDELYTSRADTVHAQAAELRRIERDLHDGAQARLVALGMSLGMAEEVARQDPDKVAEMLADARQSTTQALSELRDLVRGIHPPVLADRGLAGAVEALAMACPMPVDCDLVLPGRVPPPVESAVYFAVAEVLTNVAKHANATRARVSLGYQRGWLWVRVADNGIGGASVENGGGLYGIRRRLEAFDGTVTVTSPHGGPTEVVIQVPCEQVPA